MFENFRKITPNEEVSLLKEKSSNILNIFTNTINELTEVNLEIEDSIDERNQKINELKEQESILSLLKENNQKMIDKLYSIID